MINSTPPTTVQPVVASISSSDSLDKSPTSKLKTAIYGRFAVVADDGTRHALLRTKKINLALMDTEHAT